MPPFAVGDPLAAVQRRGVPELRPVAQRGVDVQHGLLAGEGVLADGDRAGLDLARAGLVAGEERLLADDGAGPDGEQVGADRHGAGQDRDAVPDPGAEHPQVERVDGGPGEQDGQRAGPGQDLDHPEPEVGQAPDLDPLRLPPADEQPFGRDRQGGQDEEGGAAEQDRAQVDVDEAGAVGDPVEGAGDDGGGQEAVAEEEQQLQRPAPDELPGAGPGRRLGRSPGFGRGLRLGRGGRCRPGRDGRRNGERRGQAGDGRVLVDVLHRHRRQPGPLPDPGAEVRHDHGVGAQVIEEVAVGRYLIGVYDLGQDRGQVPGAPVLGGRSFPDGQRRLAGWSGPGSR